MFDDESSRSTPRWRELTDEQKCVIALASEESDLLALLYGWDVNWRPGDLSMIERLQRAIVDLFDARLIKPFRTEGQANVPFTREQLIAATGNAGAWWPGEEGLEEVVWLVLIDEGDAVLRQATDEELRRFYASQ